MKKKMEENIKLVNIADEWHVLYGWNGWSYAKQLKLDGDDVPDVDTVYSEIEKEERKAAEMESREVYIGGEKVNLGDFEKIEDESGFWNDKFIKTVKLAGDWYILDGWNGEAYTKCWKCTDYSGLHRADNDLYQLTPAQVGNGEPDEDGDYPQYETIGYKIEKGCK